MSNQNEAICPHCGANEFYQRVSFNADVPVGIWQNDKGDMLTDIADEKEYINDVQYYEINCSGCNIPVIEEELFERNQFGEKNE